MLWRRPSTARLAVALTPADTDVPGRRTGSKTLGELLLGELERAARGGPPSGGHIPARTESPDPKRRAREIAGRAREQPTGTGQDAWPELSDEADDSDLVQEELSRCLRPLLGGLPPEQRRAVEMIDLEGMAQADAARREGVSVSGMKSRVQRGRRRLAQLLDACCALTLDARGLPMDYTPTTRPGPGSCGCAS
jgi:hypothetical protein